MSKANNKKRRTKPKGIILRAPTHKVGGESILQHISWDVKCVFLTQALFVGSDTPKLGSNT